MPKVDPAALPLVTGCSYPPPYDKECAKRSWKRLGIAGELTQFGVNIMTLPPGTWSSQRHWHAVEDEFVYVLSGVLVLVEDEGEEVLGPGDAAAFKGGVKNGHCLQNRSLEEAKFLVVGSRSDDDWGEYSDLDLKFDKGRYTGSGRYTKKNGTTV